MIFSAKTLKCGCVVKHYAGGTRVTSGCAKHPKKVEYICPVCGKRETQLKKLKEHRWSHAVD